MLYDRPYMRQPSYGGRMLWTYKLMIANAVVFVVQMVLLVWAGVAVTERLAAL